MKKTIFCKTIITFVCILMMSACGLFFNPSTYVKAALDALYKGELEQYSNVTSTPISQAQSQYEAGYKSQADVLATVYGFTDKNGIINMSDQIRAQVEDLCKELYGQIEYKINEKYEKTKSEYKVEVKVTPITTLKDNMMAINEFVENYNANIIAGKYNDEIVYSQDMIDLEYEQGILDILKNVINNPTYGQPQTIFVRVMCDVDRNSYYINTDDLIAMNKAIIKYPS